jgi:hypothetical protein
MDQLWGVLGRACVDGGFATDLKGVVVVKKVDGYTVPEDEVAGLDDLQKVLTAAGFRASLWERGELNRIFYWLKEGKGAQALRNLAEIWQKLPGLADLPRYPAELWRLVGLCCIDKQVASRFFAEPEKVGDLVKEDPKFSLGSADVEVLAKFFEVKEAEQWLGVVHRESWIPPTGAEQAAFYRGAAAKLLKLADDVKDDPQPMVQCAPSYEGKPMKLLSYRHPPSPLLERVASDLVFASTGQP